MIASGGWRQHGDGMERVVVYPDESLYLSMHIALDDERPGLIDGVAECHALKGHREVGLALTVQMCGVQHRIAVACFELAAN